MGVSVTVYLQAKSESKYETTSIHSEIIVSEELSSLLLLLREELETNLA